MNKVIVLGGSGSGGSYLCENLIEKGFEVYSLSRWHSTSIGNKNLEKIKDKIKVVECDLSDLSSVIRALEKVKPDYIYHLASNANVALCFESPIAILDNNIKSAINVFEAIRILNINPITVFSSTSELYGSLKKEDCPVKESQPINPVNIYSISKTTQEQIAACYHNSFNQKNILVRSFTYINPRRGDIFSSAFAKQIIQIEREQKKELVHGNLDSIRSIVDIRDIAEAYYLASQKCLSGEPYNIGSSVPISVGEFLEVLKSKAKVKIKSRTDTSLLRLVDISWQVPDSTKFVKQTGWAPKYTLEQSIDFLLDYYRNQP